MLFKIPYGLNMLTKPPVVKAGTLKSIIWNRLAFSSDAFATLLLKRAEDLKIFRRVNRRLPYRR